MGSNHSHTGSAAYINLPFANLAGKFKKYSIANLGTMKTDIQSALSATGFCDNSNGAGYLNAEANSQIENSTTGPMYVWAGSGGTSVTTMTDQGCSFIPIIFGMDYGNGTGYGPTWGLTMVYNDNGNVEETYDAGGVYNASGGSLYAAYIYGSSASDAFSNWTMNGSDGTVGMAQATNTATGDQT
tara:strand:- start:52 stop:606 length:555 start_codon:yes stop_codon:yes gene_type:complete